MAASVAWFGGAFANKRTPTGINQTFVGDEGDEGYVGDVGGEEDDEGYEGDERHAFDPTPADALHALHGRFKELATLNAAYLYGKTEHPIALAQDDPKWTTCVPLLIPTAPSPHRTEIAHALRELYMLLLSAFDMSMPKPPMLMNNNSLVWPESFGEEWATLTSNDTTIGQIADTDIEAMRKTFADARGSVTMLSVNDHAPAVAWLHADPSANDAVRAVFNHAAHEFMKSHEGFEWGDEVLPSSAPAVPVFVTASSEMKALVRAVMAATPDYKWDVSGAHCNEWLTSVDVMVKVKVVLGFISSVMAAF